MNGRDVAKTSSNVAIWSLSGVSGKHAIGCPHSNVADVGLGSSRSDRQDHSPLMFAALTIGHHFSISTFWKAASASGVCCSGGGMARPWSAMRACTAGSARASTTT